MRDRILAAGYWQFPCQFSVFPDFAALSPAFSPFVSAASHFSI
jgi:hypothetical protein